MRAVLSPDVVTMRDPSGLKAAVITAIEERLQTPRTQRRIDIRSVAPVRTRIADKHVEDFVPHGKSRAANQQLSENIHAKIRRRKHSVNLIGLRELSMRFTRQNRDALWARFLQTTLCDDTSPNFHGCAQLGAKSRASQIPRQLCDTSWFEFFTAENWRSVVPSRDPELRRRRIRARESSGRESLASHQLCRKSRRVVYSETMG
jgi:hypothetical protein